MNIAVTATTFCVGQYWRAAERMAFALIIRPMH